MGVAPNLTILSSTPSARGGEKSSSILARFLDGEPGGVRSPGRVVGTVVLAALRLAVEGRNEAVTVIGVVPRLNGVTYLGWAPDGVQLSILGV